MKYFSSLLRITLLAALLAATALSATPVTQARAENFIGVYTDSDSIYAGDGLCSLREAIVNANNDAATHTNCAPGSGNDTIIFADHVQTIYLASPLPTITDQDGLTIDGGDDVTISGQYQHRIFWSTGFLTLRRLTLMAGYVGVGFGAGGAVRNAAGGTLIVHHSTFYDNEAMNGGAIYNDGGNLTVTNSVFLSNSTNIGNGGAISTKGTATLLSNTFSENSAVAGGGDLFVVSGSAVLTNNIFANSQGGGHCLTNGVVPVTARNNLFEGGPVNTCGQTHGVDGNLVGFDPQFDPNHWAWWMPSKTSPVIDAGLDSACVNTVSYYGVPRPQGPHCDIGAYEYPQTVVQQNFAGDGNLDGWVLEFSETSEFGFTHDSTATTLRVGDDAGNRQYKSIISFDTSGLPDDAVIGNVVLWLKAAGQTGTNPFMTHGPLLVDIHNGGFNGDLSLQPADFQAEASQNNIGQIPSTFVNGWYTQSWTSGIFHHINREGPTEFRLHFTFDDNNNLSADFINIVSGNVAGDGPLLLVYYWVR